jgi:hypothetical protein
VNLSTMNVQSLMNGLLPRWKEGSEANRFSAS